MVGEKNLILKCDVLFFRFGFDVGCIDLVNYIYNYCCMVYEKDLIVVKYFLIIVR